MGYLLITGVKSEHIRHSLFSSEMHTTLASLVYLIFSQVDIYFTLFFLFNPLPHGMSIWQYTLCVHFLATVSLSEHSRFFLEREDLSLANYVLWV